MTVAGSKTTTCSRCSYRENEEIPLLGHMWDDTTGRCTRCGTASFVVGDADGNGELNLKDVVLIRRSLADGWNVEIDALAADVDGDRDVTLQDVTLITRYIAGGWGVVLV